MTLILFWWTYMNWHDITYTSSGSQVNIIAKFFKKAYIFDKTWYNHLASDKLFQVNLLVSSCVQWLIAGPFVTTYFHNDWTKKSGGIIHVHRQNPCLPRLWRRIPIHRFRTSFLCWKGLLQRTGPLPCMPC
jgi:hypothetical protein